MVFPAVMYGCESWTYKQSWVPKNWCFWTVVLEKTPESPLDCKEIQPVHSKGNHSWIFVGRTNAEAETPILRPPDAKNWLTGKDPDAGKDWRQEEKGMTEDEIVGWPYRLDGHEFEQALGVSDGQAGLACSPWGRKESDMTEWIEELCTYCILLAVLKCGENTQVLESVNLGLTPDQPLTSCVAFGKLRKHSGPHPALHSLSFYYRSGMMMGTEES